MQRIVQYILFKTTITVGFTVISGCFPLLYPQSGIMIPHFIFLILAGLQRMYITAWPADDLKEVCTRLTWSIYGVSWIGKSQRMKKDIFMMLQRSQKPFLMTMGGILPALTLEYYGHFVASVMSYFMTIRVAISS